MNFTEVKCDRCNAKAAKKIVLPNGLDLIFCQHHTNRYSAQIKADIVITDLEPVETPVPVG